MSTLFGVKIGLTNKKTRQVRLPGLDFHSTIKYLVSPNIVFSFQPSFYQFRGN